MYKQMFGQSEYKQKLLLVPTISFDEVPSKYSFYIWLMYTVQIVNVYVYMCVCVCVCVYWY